MTPPTRPPHVRRAAPLAAAALAVSLLPAAAQAAPPASRDAADVPVDCPWMETSLSPAERTELLLDASSPRQVMRWLVEQPAAQPERTTFPGGVVYPEQVPCTPDITFANGGPGLNATGATAFPVPIAEAAAFDEELSRAKGAMVASETFRAGRNVLLGPGMAGGRTPLSGRTSEYYGEDPVLSGALTGASARGLESLPDMPVVANLKHYVANEQELDRDASSSNVDERTRRQIYDLPFEIAAAESGAGSIMCSYNQLNGVYACENPALEDVVKGDWGYEGFVMSDFGAVHSTAASLDAGLDMELNRPIWYTPERLEAALAAGEITDDQIRAAATRVVRTFIDVGLFDHPVPEVPSTDLITPESRALAREMAEKGSVLLENDGVLPLGRDDLDVAVIGPWASEEPTGGTSATTVCSSYLPFGRTGLSVPCPDLVSPLEAITERVEAAGGTVVFDGGDDPARAAAVAADADVALVFGWYQMGETADREDLHLEDDGDALISAVAASNDSTVAVLAAGSAVEMPWVDDVAAVLHTWYPGLEMGGAISGLLWGDVSPSGRLPMTFPRSLEDTPTQAPEQYPGVFADGSTERTDPDAIRQVEYSEGLQVGYRWYLAQGIDPLFEFGHGLTYTTFDYDRLRVTPRVSDGTGRVDVSFSLTNSGERAGTEVAQVYAELPDAAGEPSRRLIAWERVELEAGETRRVRISMDAEELATRHLLQHWDTGVDGWVTPSGRTSVQVGRSSQDLPLRAEVRLR
ncbi:glycoside hydrolase family 3 protein [uncultured Pseudokineococcus sp.]|uniref:beta-glucosidase n=1 Tax=uncultured Pseudokineococcus sp. TaxID=1642928 RepID=UPI00260EC8E0|nr:glycoside hydrolase family 3 C-terminal domain-containing protein [uncultured Pseudokineococcus sp.]